MLNQFSRTELIYGRDAMEMLKDARVAVFGIGGVGGYTVEALARSGVGSLDLIDDDKVCLTNINRQIYATRKTVGQYKVDVAAERIKDINPDAVVRTYKTFYTPETADQFDFKHYDYIVDAIDTVAAKLALAEYAKEHGIPLIASMGTGNKLHPELFQIADISETSVCPLCRVMRRELKKRGIERLKVLYSRETPIKPREQTEQSSESGLEEPEKIEGTAPRKRAVPGSVSFVPPAAGMMLAGCVIRSLAGIDDNL